MRAPDNGSKMAMKKNLSKMRHDTCLSFLSFHIKGNDDIDSIIDEEISR